MLHFIADRASYLALAGPEYDAEYGPPWQYPCIGYRVEHRRRPGFFVWSFLYLTDLAFSQMLAAYLGDGECGHCGSDRISVTLIRDVFAYGAGIDAVQLECKLPVRQCKNCGACFVDHAGENIRDATVAAYRRTLESGAASPDAS